MTLVIFGARTILHSLQYVKGTPAVSTSGGRGTSGCGPPPGSARGCAPQRHEERADPGRVGAHVTPADTGLGPHVDRGAVPAARRYPNHHVVLEVEPARRRRRLDA